MSGSAISRIRMKVAMNHPQPAPKRPWNQAVIGPAPPLPRTHKPRSSRAKSRGVGTESSRAPLDYARDERTWRRPARSFRGLRIILAVQQLRRAALQCRRGAGDGVGEVEVLDRVGDGRSLHELR